MDADALVIGAGAAGLAAARALSNRFARVILIEARDRVGGRIFPKPITDLVTTPELGAEFIHGQAEETNALMREAGSASIDISREAWSYENGALRRDRQDILSSAALFERAQGLSTDQSVEAFLGSIVADPAMREAADNVRYFVEGFEAADPAIASVCAIAAEVASGVDSRSARPLAGYAPILRRLHQACVDAGAQIELSRIVRAVRWRRGGVQVQTVDSHGEARTFEAARAVVTLPIGVLRQHGGEGGVLFEPELPGSKRAALAHLEMGHVVKIALWFRSAFWERVAQRRFRDATFFHRDDALLPSYWTQLPIRSELIVAWAGGPKATALRGRCAEELVASAREDFGMLFNDAALARDQFVGAAMHDWSSDPFARGAYSYVTVGGSDARATLAAPIDDTLFFAGEATSTDGQGGTVNGALQTGARAAAEIDKRLTYRDSRYRSV